MNGFRSQKVVDMNPSRVNRLKIDARGQTFDLARTPKGWRLLAPVAERADDAAVNNLLTRLAELKASEFLDEKAIPNAKLDPPNIRVRGWQAEAGNPKAENEDGAPLKEPATPPRFDLAFGRSDALRKSVFGRVAGDKTVLAMPDTILADLPVNAFAFRDRSVVSFSPQDVTRLTVERGASRLTLESPRKPGRSTNGGSSPQRSQSRHRRRDVDARRTQQPPSRQLGSRARRRRPRVRSSRPAPPRALDPQIRPHRRAHRRPRRRGNMTAN